MRNERQAYQQLAAQVRPDRGWTVGATFQTPSLLPRPVPRSTDRLAWCLGALTAAIAAAYILGVL